MVREVRLAVLAAVDLMAIQVDVVRKPHCPDSSADCRRYCAVRDRNGELELELGWVKSGKLR
jgi:hypothetical protein